MNLESYNGRQNGNGTLREGEVLRDSLSEQQQAKVHEQTRILCGSVSDDLRRILYKHCPGVHPDPLVEELYHKMYERFYGVISSNNTQDTDSA